mgnify:FL=1
MSLGLVEILVIALAAVLFAALIPPRWRGWAILLGSVIGIYWLQPPLAPRWADFLLPSATIALGVAGWWLSRQHQQAFLSPVHDDDDHPGGRDPHIYVQDDWLTLLVVMTVILALSLFRYAPAELRLTASRPPTPLFVAVTALEVGLLFLALAIILRRVGHWVALNGGIAAILFLFVLVKWSPATTVVAGWWRSLTEQDVSLAAPSDLVWLGFAYVVVRIIHTIRDRRMNVMPDMPLSAYLSYILFIPAFVAGPIDRIQRFSGDYHALGSLRGFDPARWGSGLWRVGEGLFKKFVVADLLAQGMSLTPALAEQTESAAAMWLLLFGYGLRIYFDFSGYTDIAIGLGMLFGFRLPENFNRPYTRSNITTFWQSWHMSLSEWARFYIFTPLSRALLRRRSKAAGLLTPTTIVLSAHLATMIAIGLWHSISWNFFIWGLWHGVGLFIHKQWSDRTRKWYRGLQGRPWPRRAWAVAGWGMTVLFVMLGWVWFLLPTPQMALDTFAKLFSF